MTAAMPWFFAALGALTLGAAVVGFWQSVRAALGLVDDASARSAGPDAEVELFARKRAVLQGLRELDFDHEAGKLSDEDHAHERERLRAEARDAIRAIDKVIGPFRAGAEALVNERIAKATGAFAASAPASSPAASTPPPSVPSTFARGESTPAALATDGDVPAETSTPASTASWFAKKPVCAACSTENDMDATFCKRCGAKIGAGAEA